MTETKQEMLTRWPQPQDVVAAIAKDAKENEGGIDKVSVGPIFADDYAGEMYRRAQSRGRRFRDVPLPAERD